MLGFWGEYLEGLGTADSPYCVGAGTVSQPSCSAVEGVTIPQRANIGSRRIATTKAVKEEYK
jgi:hypothetical protein